MKQPEKYYDRKGRRLVYVGQKADTHYWDAHWQLTNNFRNQLLNVRRSFVTDVTKRFLTAADGPVLEGGCGTAVHVAALSNNGYRVVGLDYAPNTVDQLNRLVPELDICLGDVRALVFADGHFAGYWSLGVIEHFYGGYDDICKEMYRVLRSDGFLFLTFPYLSPLRRLKARLSLYPLLEEKDTEPEGFYQFALNVESVISRFEREGFTVVAKRSLSGLKGVKDEVNFLSRPLQRLYDYKGRNRLMHAFGKILDWGLSWFGGHTMMLVMRRTSATQ